MAQQYQHMVCTNLEYMQMHMAALYTYANNGCIVGCNQFNGGAVPRFHLARTHVGNLCVFRRDVPPDLVASMRRLVSEEPALDGHESAPVYQDEYLARLADHASIAAVWQGPAYRFTNTACVDPPNVVEIGDNNKELLVPLMGDWLPDVPHRRPFKAVIADGRAVAVCASVRITAQAHEAGVETAPAYRRRGCAAAVVAAWAKAVAWTGAEPLYSTSWENVGSQAVACSLGLELFGTDFHIR